MKLKYSSQFKRDYKAVMKRGYDIKLLIEMMEKLKTGEPLDEKYHDHALAGKYVGFRECHVKPDWLLIYKCDGEFVRLQGTGTHSDLF